ncbi:TPA: DUF1120 domain-containing protein [Salmonella enterica]|uniref:DUF1120 domain-containing protein n=2 Tax=Salmonella enterica TaxID=28901 RepID=A0A5Y2QNG7_SALER|nr:DUF1120 domain-containing protein [Salmonella enterica]EBH9039930.1 DUF1120 domain-containing protein [Salmonella enterica subsp. indica serovar 11:b:e,n,x]ECF4923953.1 DUF1120 domain-containing protein [Salmonella enterica subsp. arizonae]HAC6566963.1 DUF1120 domain-containing protein [Salmonella enterica subsp. indica]HAE8196735.1 DUF1120 domain-containing protein [Salmonella enterica subsp. indica serovar 41:b:1,7]HCM1936415.1 DUF1120 domain-containing protein [Salmonella enterica subsp.
MNAIFKKGLLASMLAVATSSAMAASSIDIQVKGKIVPSSCTPSFTSGGGIADFGTIKVAALNATTMTALPDLKTIPISITCEEATRVAVTFNDAHADSAPTADLPITYADTDFSIRTPATAGLGMYNGKKIGAYSIGIQTDAGKATNDKGDNLFPICSDVADATVGWMTKSGSHYMQIETDKSEFYSFTATKGSGQPDAQKQFNFIVGLMAAINPTNDLDITDEATLDGLTNVELVYL